MENPPIRELPAAAAALDWPAAYQMRADGLYLQEHELWLCQPFEVVGQCAEPDGSGQGIVIAFTDSRQRRHTLLIARADLAAGGKVLRELLDHGFLPGLEPGCWPQLQRFFLLLRPPQPCLLVEKTGWVDGAFVLPDRVIGAGGRRIHYRGVPGGWAGARSGTLEQWQQEVAALCPGNSRLLFALSLAFAAPLAPLTQLDGALFNLVAPSSSGKTTVLHCAASVGGSGADLQSWPLSAAGLEAAALAHNHRLLIFDQFASPPPGQMPARLGHLTSGRGLLRTAADGRLRAARQWQTLVLSAGEAALEGMGEGDGTEVPAAQLTRVIDLPALVETGSGLFENLHGRADGAVFAQALLERCRRLHGTALPAYLERLCAEDRGALVETYLQQQARFLEGALTPCSQAQLRRVACRFFLVGFAGELAGRYDVTGWPAGAALTAARNLFATWMRHSRGYQSLDARRVLERLREFFDSEQHRFLPLGGAPARQGQRPPPNLAGYRLAEGGRMHYYVRAAVFSKEILGSLDRHLALRVLREAGRLLPNLHTDEPFLSKRLPDASAQPQRIYHLIDAEPGEASAGGSRG